MVMTAFLLTLTSTAPSELSVTLDGLWFAIDGNWLGPASPFASGQGYVRMDYPATSGLRVSRRDFVPAAAARR
jgi:hypothetical protein